MQASPIIAMAIASIALFSSFSSIAAFKAIDQHSSLYPNQLEAKPIVAYFDSVDKHNGYIQKPVKDGFYRVLIGRNNQGHYLIQDFFQDNSQAQTQPYWVTSIEGLFQFGVEYIQGPITGYFKNGRVSFKTQMNNGKYIDPFESFYPTGQLANRTLRLKNGEMVDQYFYIDGKKALELKYAPNGERTQTQVWHSNGQSLDENQAEMIEEEILEAIRFDR